VEILDRGATEERLAAHLKIEKGGSVILEMTDNLDYLLELFLSSLTSSVAAWRARCC
jgi:hypothetical protein